MKIILNLLIFCLVLFIYLHIHFHNKTCNDLELYEIELPSKDKLEEICDLRQPVVFEYFVDSIMTSCNQKTIQNTYGAFSVKIRNLTDIIGSDEEMYIPISFTSALDASKADNDKKYLIEAGDDFLEETAMIKILKYNDSFIRPHMVSKCMYDILWGCEGLRTPFKYELNYRNYFMVTEGSIKIKMAPPKSSKYLHKHSDYENFEFRSPINPWDIQKQYKDDFDKIKCLEVVVNKGFIIHLPAFWWYSIEFGKETTIVSLKYRTYMNTCAILPKLLLKALQSQNVKRQIVNIKHITNNNEIKNNIIKGINFNI